MKKGHPVIRFFEKVKISKNCWEWRGAKNKAGYGNFWDGSKQTGSHQFSYRHFYGEIPEGMCVMHSCDNPGCVSPWHISLGTRRDNTQDCILKERHRHGPNKTLKFAKKSNKI